MGTVVELYEALASAPDDRARARLIAEAFERLEERYPHLPDLVTQRHLRETESPLLKVARAVPQRVQGRTQAQPQHSADVARPPHVRPGWRHGGAGQTPVSP